MPKLALILSSLAFLLFAVPASAQMPSQAMQPATSTMPANTLRTTTPNTATTQGNSLQARALSEIDRRLTSLSTALSKLASMENVPADIKANLTAEIQTEIDNLTKLKADIQAAQTQATLSAPVGSVVSSFRVYAVFTPKILILNSAYRMMNVADMLSAVQTRLLTQVATQAGQGQDVSALETALTDAEENITLAKESAQSAVEQVAELTPLEYPANRTALQAARADLTAANTSLLAARESLGEVVTGLMTLSSPSANVDMVDPAAQIPAGNTGTATSVSPSPMTSPVVGY